MKLISKTKAPAVKPTGRVKLEHIVDFPEIKNREIDKEFVAELAASIEKNGLDTPLFVWDGGEEYPKVEINRVEVDSNFLVAGFHRRAAIRVLRKTNAGRFNELFGEGIPVKRFSGSLQDMLLLQLRENVSRNNPTAEELLPQMIRLREEFSMRNKTIAASIGRSESFVTQIFSIEKELGDEGVKEVLKGGMKVKDALKAAAKVKSERAAGKTPNVGAIIKKATKHAAERAESGGDREEKRTSFKKLYEAYKALPEMDDEEKLKIAEGLMAYVAGDRDSIPKLLRPEKKEKSRKTADEE